MPPFGWEFVEAELLAECAEFKEIALVERIEADSLFQLPDGFGRLAELEVGEREVMVSRRALVGSKCSLESRDGFDVLGFVIRVDSGFEVVGVELYCARYACES